MSIPKQLSRAAMLSLTGVAFAGEPESRTTVAPYRNWENVRIDGGGFVTGLIPGAADGGSLFARTDVGGAYVWDSPKKHWVPITDALGPIQVESLAADPARPGRVYIASSGNIHRSDDLGRNWSTFKISARMAGNGPGRCVGERLAIDPNSSDILFFGSRQDGLLRSTDSGATWTQVPGFTDIHGQIGITFVLFDAGSGSAGTPTPSVYLGVAGAEASIYQSKDGGTSWTPVPNQPEGMFPNHAVFGKQGFLFLSYANGAGPSDMKDGAVWRLDTTKTGPEAWREISPVDPQKGSGDFFGYGSLALDPRNPDTLVVASMDRWNWGDAMWRSLNANAEIPAWTELFSRKVKPVWTSPVAYASRDTHWISDIEFHPAQPGQAFYGFGLGVQRTDDLSAEPLAAWEFSARGIEETVVLAMASPPAGAPLVSGLGDIGGFVHTKLDESPTYRHSKGNTTSVDVAEKAPSIMARVGTEPGSFSTDWGKSWTRFPSQSPGKGGNIAISANGRTMFWMGSEGGHYTRNHGKTWKNVPSVPKGSRIVSDRVNPSKFYAFDSKEGRVHISIDGGKTFELSEAKVPGTHGYLRSSIRAVPGREGHLFLNTQNWKFFSCLHVSTDSGKTFTPVSGTDHNEKAMTENTAIRTIRSFGFGMAMPGRTYPALYLSGVLNLPDEKAREGIYRSDDAGRSWSRIDDERLRFPADCIVGDSRTPGRVYLGTPGRGIVFGTP